MHHRKMPAGRASLHRRQHHAIDRLMPFTGDLLMATAMIGEGTNYADLAYTVRLSEEEYGVGFRKGSDLAKALNDFFAECYEDESIVKCAEKYNLQDMLVK